MSTPSTPGPAVADLLGLVAFGELLAFERMAGDARLAPDLHRRAAPNEMAAAEIAKPDRALVLDVLHDSRYADFAAAEIRLAVADDPRVAGRLSMWARRLVGEAPSQANGVAAERAALTALVARGDRVDVPGLFGRLTAAHTARMAAAGLNN
ncbi:ferritin-like domain-containing protein [Micromonospora sp. LAH09]|uniref:ferritin-like fold-containing protein n=1 Tax=Micromonospora cabrerizensis TaxID=2911213 RepID=UPI001EE81E2E|nr:ferritin-like fold-containing protein [Micromonospora cabrerizensis]MCG5468888.1 ferritin-like domain-containing protein [Micromonospora cabrerizensis]